MFVEQLKNFASPKDVLIAISFKDYAPEVVRAESALMTARQSLELGTIGGAAPSGRRYAAGSPPSSSATDTISRRAVRTSKRSARIAKFEEQFPDALDLVSRAIRAGHAFQAAIGMAAEELASPAGPEFKKVFDQQNFGLPLRDALNALAERVPLVDVKFFVTAVAIQRDTGGNLAEILDNLAHVVRERFKIRRQVRVHTAHGRFTGYVLLALPPALGVVLSQIAPEQMQLLFRERMGQTMLIAAMVMQTVGFIWIRQVIKIEV